MKIMVLLIDNYDSFSYNLYQLIGTITPDIKVIRNDEMTPEEIEILNPSHIIVYGSIQDYMDKDKVTCVKTFTERFYKRGNEDA